MPFASKAQAAYFNANRAKLEKQGVNVGEWNKSTDFSHLPQKVSTHGMLGVPDSNPESKHKPLPRRR